MRVCAPHTPRSKGRKRLWCFCEALLNLQELYHCRKTRCDLEGTDAGDLRVWRERTPVNCCLWYLSPRCYEWSSLPKSLNVSSIPLRLPAYIGTTYCTCVFFQRTIDANRIELFSAGWEAGTSASNGVSGPYSLFQVGRRFSSRPSCSRLERSRECYVSFVCWSAS